MLNGHDFYRLEKKIAHSGINGHPVVSDKELKQYIDQMAVMVDYFSASKNIVISAGLRLYLNTAVNMLDSRKLNKDRSD